MHEYELILRLRKDLGPGTYTGVEHRLTIEADSPADAEAQINLATFDVLSCELLAEENGS